MMKESKYSFIKTKWIRRFLSSLVVLFIIMNIVASLHAYKFTHFSNEIATKTNDAKHLSFIEKIKTVVTGISNPRPVNRTLPTGDYETIRLSSNKEIICWSIKTKNAKGTIILFHGYSGEKSSMLDESNEFNNLGYNTLLVDFMGSGASEGNQTTIGFKEAAEVKTCFDYLINAGEHQIYLFGTSMGAVAILKAIYDYHIQPAGIIIECPFGSMYQTTCARFKTMGVPVFPMAGLLVFWGGIENDFWAFSHNPTKYAKAVNCPTLLLYGEKDEKVSREEIEEIFHNLKGEKELKTYALAGHENYLREYKEQWIMDIRNFLPSKL